MRLLRGFLLLALLLLPIPELYGNDAWSEAVEASNLSETEVKRLRQEALAGDARSSYTLATRFGGHVHFAIHEHLFYLRLSAEQGSCRALREFARWQRTEALHEALRTPGDWTARAIRCEKQMRVVAPHTEG